MKQLRYILSLLLLTIFCWQPAIAQSDIEMTDSTSTEWGDDIGGGLLPNLPTDPVTSITLSQTNITVEGGGRVRLTVHTNSTAANKAVTWSVADGRIACVYDDGTVIGLKKGTTAVKATSVSNPSIFAVCNVTVTSDFVNKLPDVPFEFFFDAANYDADTQSIPNHESATLNGYNLQLSANIPVSNRTYLTLNERCEGYIDRWGKGSGESGSYFYRSGQDNMTIVCKVKPRLDTGNTSDFISNRSGGYNYMLRIGQQNTLFLHTRTAYQDDRALKLSASDEPQIFAVRVNGSEDYIQIDNLSTGESHKVHGVSWGDGGNVMKFFYNDGGEYWMGDFYWMYYSFEYLTDEQLQDLYYYRSDIAETTYIPGDVNNDGVVAVNDVVLAINAVLGQTPEGFVHEAADMSGDGQIMVNDVVLMINVILGVDSSPAKARKFLEDNFRYLLKE